MLTLISIFIPSLSFIIIKLYGGLLLFSCFVIYDTQVITEQVMKVSLSLLLLSSI